MLRAAKFLESFDKLFVPEAQRILAGGEGGAVTTGNASHVNDGRIDMYRAGGFSGGKRTRDEHVKSIDSADRFIDKLEYIPIHVGYESKIRLIIARERTGSAVIRKILRLIIRVAEGYRHR